MESLKGKILTVIGPVSPDQLQSGIVLPHEQLFLDLRKLGNKVQTSVDLHLNDLEELPITIGNLGKIRQYPYSVSENLILDSETDLIDELELFKCCGGSVICEVTPNGVRKKSSSLKSVAEATGLNIVCGTGFYVDDFLPMKYRDMGSNELASVMVDEIINGIPGSDGVRCGIIGEIGCSSPLNVNEKKVLQAAARAQQETGAPIMIHPGQDRSSPLEIIDVLRSAGANLEKTVIGHLDRTLIEVEDFMKVVETGCIAELDLFGTECSHHQFFPEFDMPSDAQRIQIVKALCERGYSDRIFISHDIHTKHRLAKYGGHGYSHIPQNIIPKMRLKGISDEDIEKITVTSPVKWLTLDE